MSGLPRNPGYGSERVTDDFRQTATCPDCAREGLVLRGANLILPRHKPQPDESLWWHETARDTTGYCKGGGRSYLEFGMPSRSAAEAVIT